jgi:hypothetical protein
VITKDETVLLAGALLALGVDKSALPELLAQSPDTLRKNRTVARARELRRERELADPDAPPLPRVYVSGDPSGASIR